LRNSLESLQAAPGFAVSACKPALILELVFFKNTPATFCQISGRPLARASAWRRGLDGERRKCRPAGETGAKRIKMRNRRVIAATLLAAREEALSRPRLTNPRDILLNPCPLLAGFGAAAR